MSRILALDSSTEACSCALNIDGRISESFDIIPREHTRQMLPMIQALMQDQGLGFEDLDAVALGAGPGSFTGLRIAAGVAQGIAFGADLPLIPVSTLASMAQQNLDKGSFILSCLDARINEVYWALFRTREGTVSLIGEEQLTRPDAVIFDESLSCFAVGNGMAFIDEMPGPTRDLIDSFDIDIYPRAAAIAELAAIQWSEGKFMDPADFSPTYLRNQVTHS